MSATSLAGYSATRGSDCRSIYCAVPHGIQYFNTQNETVGSACSERKGVTGAFAPTSTWEGELMTYQIDRRSFLNNLGVTIGAAAATASAVVPASAQVAKPKGNIPSTPLKLGHMTFLTGPAAVLGEPSLKGHLLAAEEINAQGGILGKRKIETVTAGENAGTDANVKELRRMKLSEKIDMFTGVI